MNFNVSKRKVTKASELTSPIKIGDKVVITVASSASMNLYDKVKSAGVVGIHCPCGIHSTESLRVIKEFANGYILQSNVSGRLTCALPKDLRRV